MKQFYLALDLKNEPEKIDAYKKYHQRVWPEILRSLGICGITSMKIYSVENRLFMIIEAEDDFEPRNIDYKKLLKIHDNEVLNFYVEDLSNTVSLYYRGPFKTL